MNGLPSLFRMLLSFALVLGLTATSVFAQDVEYAQLYEEAMQTAREASQLEDSDIEQAADQYAEAYQMLAQAAEQAENEGQLDHSDQMRERGAQIAYRAGKLLFDNDMPEEAIPHFEFGRDLEPAFAANQQGLEAAERALQQGPIVEASRAINDGNPIEALELLEEAEENATVFFYRAEAHMLMDNYAEVVANANQALNTDEDIDANRRARLHLLIGESHMYQGNSDQARESLEIAANQGPVEIRERAEALLESL